MEKERARRVRQGVLGIKTKPHDLPSSSAQDPATAQFRNELLYAFIEAGFTLALFGQLYLEKGLEACASTCLPVITPRRPRNWPVFPYTRMRLGHAQ